MNLVALDIPDDPAEWPAWLERQLVSVQLGELVDELEVLTGKPDEEAPSLETVLGGQSDEVLQSGLSTLNLDQLGTFLKHPRLLLDLQELVLIEGGEHWLTLSADAADRDLVDDGWQRIEAATGGATAPAGPAAQRAPVAKPGAGPRPRRRLVVLLATVAGIAVVALTLWLQRPPATGWGWDRPGALALDMPADQYLNHLADSADEWFKKRPDTPEALAQRLREFRHGCDTLIAAPHEPLAQADREWLVERCRAWSGKLDGHLADLSSGTKSLEQVQTEADETVRKLMQAIRDRAGQVV